MRSNEPMPTEQDLTLNLLEIVFNKDTLSLMKAEYSHTLYEKYKGNQDFFIYKYGGSLYIWELHRTDELLPSTFREAKITIEEHAPIFRKIVESAIVQLFRDYKRHVYLRKYSSIWELELKDEKQEKFESLLLQPTLTFSLENLRSTLNGKQVIALSLRRRLKPVFNANDETIRNQLANIDGLTRNDDGKIKTTIENQFKYLVVCHI